MTLRISAEQFGPNDYRGRIERGTESFEFAAESVAVLLSRMLDVHDAMVGRTAPASEQAPEPEAEREPVAPAAPRRMIPRRK